MWVVKPGLADPVAAFPSPYHETLRCFHLTAVNLCAHLNHLGELQTNKINTQSRDSMPELLSKLVWGGVLASVFLKVRLHCGTRVEDYCLVGSALP